MVRQRSAKPLRPGSNPGGASKTKRVERLAFFVLEHHPILCVDRNAGGSSRVSKEKRHDMAFLCRDTPQSKEPPKQAMLATQGDYATGERCLQNEASRKTRFFRFGVPPYPLHRSQRGRFKPSERGVSEILSWQSRNSVFEKRMASAVSVLFRKALQNSLRLRCRTCIVL